jgi:hypothetical protein
LAGGRTIFAGLLVGGVAAAPAVAVATSSSAEATDNSATRIFRDRVTAKT